MSNGYPMAAIIGRAEVLGAAQKPFISSTYWTDRIGPAAALATIQKHRKHRVHEHLQLLGAKVQQGWKDNAQRTVYRLMLAVSPPWDISALNTPRHKPLELSLHS
jgi:glutamate-1-semialdehyde 2,1-aminomutase